MNRYFVKEFAKKIQENRRKGLFIICLLYTSDAADE